MLLKIFGIAILSLGLCAPLVVDAAAPTPDPVQDEVPEQVSEPASADAVPPVALARAFMLQGRSEDARRMFEALLVEDPDDAEANRWLGRLALREGRTEEAIARLERAVALAPRDPGARLDLATAYETGGRVDEAERAYRDLIRFDEGPPEPWFRLGAILSGSGRGDEAIEAYERAAAHPEVSPAVARASAEALDRLYEERVDDWVERIAADAVGPGEVIGFGRRLEERRRLEEAERLFAALVRQVPDDAQARYWYGRVLFTRRQVEAGVEQLARSLELAPDNVRLKAEVARTWEVAGRIEAARQAFAEVLGETTDPTLAREALQRVSLIDARRAVEAGELETALDIYRRMLEASPDDARILGLIAPVLEELGRFDESDRVFTTMLAQQPDDAGLRMRIAATWERRGEIGRARLMYAEVVALQPTGELPTLALERLGVNRAADLMHEGQPAEALALFEEILGLTPGSQVAQLGIAMALHRLGRHDEAESAYHAVLESAPGSELAWLELGDLYRDIERPDEAIAAYEQAERFVTTEQQAALIAGRLNPLYAGKLTEIIEAQQRGEAGTEEVIAFGETLVRRGFNADALRVLQMVLDEAIEEPRIHAWMGRAELGRGEVDSGIAAFERALELAPANFDLWLELARIYEQAGRLDDAERAWRELIRLTPDAETRDAAERSLALLQARRLHEADDLPGALGVVEDLVERFPEDVALELMRARVLLLMDRDDDAQDVFARLIARSLDSVAPLLQAAQVYAGTGRPQAAERMYEGALALEPANIGVRLAVAAFHQSEARYDDAFDEYEHALALAEGTADEAVVRQAMDALAGGMIEQARGLMTAQSFDEAETILVTLVERRPGSAQANFLLSEVSRIQGDFARQAELLARVVAATEANPVMTRRLAFAYANADMLDEAARTLGEVVGVFPFDSEVRARLAEVRARQGDGEGARIEYVQLLQLNPTPEWRAHALDRLGLGAAREHRERGEIEQAVAIVESLVAELPGEPLVRLEMARVQQAAGRSAEAEAALREVLALAPAHAEARLRLARIFATTGRGDAAVETYHALASERPPPASAAEARAERDRLLAERAQDRIRATEGLSIAGAVTTLTPLGIELFNYESLDAAQEVFEHLVRIAPDAPEPHYWLGRVLAERDELADAVIVMRRSIDLEPGEPRYLLGLGRVYRELDLDLLAEEMLEEAVAQDPDGIEARFELAALYEALGDEARARTEYVRVLERATARAPVARALGGLGLAEDPDLVPEEALGIAARTFEEALAAAPRAPQVRLYVAVIYHRLGRSEEAEAIYRQMMASERGQPQAQAGLRLAHLLGGTGRIDEALALYERLIAGVPDPRINATAVQQQTALYVGEAERLAETLDEGEGDLAEARRLARILVDRNAHDEAVPMLEAALRRAPSDPQLLYYLGRAHADRGRFDVGIPLLERSAALLPDNHLLQSHLATAYGRSGETEKALPILEGLARQTGEPGLRQEAQMRLALLRAERFAAEGEFGAALREYDALLETNPDDVSLLGQRGVMLIQLGRGDEADATFGRVLELAPDNLAVRLRLAGIHRARDDNARYLEQLAAIIDIDPRSAESREARSQLGFDAAMDLIAQGNTQDAEEVLERILTTVPRDPLTRFQLGQLHADQGRLAEAEAELLEVVRIVPDYPNAYLALGRLYERLDREDSAVRAYEQVMAIDRNSPVARDAQPLLAALYGARVQRLLAEGRRDEAREGLHRLLDSDPGNIAARTTLASLHVQTQQFEEAQRELEAAARFQPDNVRVQVQLGGIFAITGQELRAAEAYANAIALTGDEQQAQEYVREVILAVARHMIAQDSPYAAIRHLRGLNEQGLGNARTHQMLAAIYRQQGRFDEATRAFRDTVRIAPDDAISRFNLAELYERSNDLDLALIQYRHIVRVGTPGELVVEEARRRATGLRTRLARFTSQLSYAMTLGESNIEEQDVTGTGAINTRFNSQTFYNLSTNFRPRPSLDLRLDTGLIYVSNHSTERDTLVPRIGASGTLNFPRQFYSFAAHASDIRELISDTFQGRTYNASVTAGIRFTDVQDLMQGLGWRRTRFDEAGEATLERSAARRVPLTNGANGNPRLREALEEAHRARFSSAAIRGEGVRRYRVGDGDGPREIAAALGFDPRRWEAEWQGSARIVDPALIVPGDTVVFVDFQDDPMIFIESGDAGAAAQFDLLAPELRLEREAQVRSAVEDGMDLYRSGTAMVRQQRYDAAQSRLERVLAIVPGDPRTLLNVGIAYRHQDRPVDAHQAWLAALESDPALQEARVRLAELYVDHGDAARAVAMLGDIAAHHAAGAAAPEGAVGLGARLAGALMAAPDAGAAAHHAALRIAGHIETLGDRGAALGIIEALLESPVVGAEANFMLAGLLLDLDRAPEAVAHAERSVVLSPDAVDHRFRLARAYGAAGDHAAADQAWRSVIAQAGDDEDAVAAAQFEAALNAAAGLAAAGEHGRALASYGTLLEVRDDDVRVLAPAADAADALGRDEEAAALMRRAVAAAPGRFDLRLRLADIELDRGDREAANDALAAALEAAGGPGERRAVLDRLGFEMLLEHLAAGRSGRAAGIIERIQVVAPDDPLVLLNLGAIRQQQRRYAEAEAAFQQVLDEDPANLTARLRLGLLYGETERIDRAIPQLEQVASEGAGHAAGRRAGAALERLEQRRLRRLVGDEIERGAPTMKTLQARFFYSDTDLPVAALTESRSYGTTLNFFYRSLNRGDWLVNYTFATRENKHPLGTDYAYVWNDLGVTWRTSVPNFLGLFGASTNIPGITGSVSLSREMRTYTFADTNALNALGQVTRRRHDTDTLSVGLTYQPPNHDRLSLFANYTWGRSRASLPVGIVFSPDGIPIAFQSRGLGDFDPNFLSMGMAFQF